MANLIRKTCTKPYQNRLARFAKRYDKNILVCFQFTVLTAVHLQNANAKFHKVEYDIIQARRKTFIFLLYDKFTQDNMYQILSQSVRFCRLYIEKNFGVLFFGSQCSFSSLFLVKMVQSLFSSIKIWQS